MTVFLLCIAAMLLITLAFVLPPLLGGGESTVHRDDRESSVAVLRDHVRELDADLERGLISPQAHASALAELTQRAAEDSRQVAMQGQGRAPRWSPMMVALLLPVGAMALYVLIGTPDALLADTRQAHAPQNMETAVANLAKRLEANPDDIEGWQMLARSYNALERYGDALRAYEHLVRLQPRDADVLADYADTLAMVNGRTLQGEPERMIGQALEADPDHPKALALAGTAAFARKDFQRAIGYWERIQRVVPPESELAQSTTNSIAEAKRQLHGDAKPTALSGVSGRVDMDPALRTQVSDEDTVFIFAREADGPPIPLAAIRRKVADLPFEFRLDDAASMAPGRKLSGATHVVVGARISKSGNALDRQGRFEAVSEPVPNGAAGLQLRIAGPKK